MKDFIKDALIRTGRPGMEDLVVFMEDIGFFEAPCSGGFHLCKVGGLAEHSINVMQTALDLMDTLLGNTATEDIRNSVIISALLHDLGKCGGHGKQFYVPNIIKDGRPTKAEPDQKYKQSTSKPFKRNPELLNVPHAVRSVVLATLFIDLTEDEEWAILTHDGLYDFMRNDIKGNETWLSLLIHWADMWSCKIIEREEREDG